MASGRGVMRRSIVVILLPVLLLLLLENGRGVESDSNYLIGLGSYDITGPAADVNMMGYANMDQTTSGVHFRLRARAFVVSEPQGKRVLFVNLDACMASQLVTIKVLERLKARLLLPNLLALQRFCLHHAIEIIYFV